MAEKEELMEQEELSMCGEPAEASSTQHATGGAAKYDAMRCFFADVLPLAAEVGTSSASGAYGPVGSTSGVVPPQATSASSTTRYDKKPPVNQVPQANVPVHYALHVTNVGCERKKPNWTELKWSAADDRYYDGPTLRLAPCVSFVTTAWCGGPLTRSVYPRSGHPGEYYWCVKVPLKYFDQYHILFIHEVPTYSGAQVRLVLLNEKDAERIAPELRQKLERKAEQYLRREKRHGSNDFAYYSNDYSDDGTKYFVNIAICDSFEILDECKWIRMEHHEHLPGNPEDETEVEKQKSRDEKMDEFIERINLMPVYGYI